MQTIEKLLRKIYIEGAIMSKSRNIALIYRDDHVPMKMCQQNQMKNIQYGTQFNNKVVA